LSELFEIFIAFSVKVHYINQAVYTNHSIILKNIRKKIFWNKTERCWLENFFFTFRLPFQNPIFSMHLLFF